MSATSVLLTEAELGAWGAAIGPAAAAEAVFVALYGELGAGKSTLVRAACRALGVEGAVPSPTFTILNVYRVPGASIDAPGASIYHADLYRLDPPVAERVLVDAGWPDVLDAGGPVFVEWADRAGGWLPADRWDVRLGIVADRPDVRSVDATECGSAPTIPPPDGGGGC